MEKHDKYRNFKITAKRLSAIIFIILLFSPALSYSKSDDTPKTITLNYQVEEFTGIFIKSGFEVIMNQNEAEPGILNITATEKQLKNIKFEVKDGILEVYSNKRIKDSETVKLYITFGNLESIKTQGFVNINTEKNMNLKKLNVDISELTVLDLYITSLDFLCEVSGKGHMKITGDINNFRLSCSEEVIVESQIFTYTLYTYIKDEADVTFKGVTDYFQVKVIGEAYLKAFDLDSRECIITVSDYGDACIYVTEQLEITGTKEGSVFFKGDPKINARYVAETVYVKGNGAKKNKDIVLGAN